MSTGEGAAAGKPAAVTMTTRQHIAWLWDYWKPHRRFLIFLFFFTLVSSAVAIAYPLVFRRVIDGVYANIEGKLPERTELSRLLGILGLIALGRMVAGFYPGFRAWMNLKLEKGVRERVFDSILGKDHTFFGKLRTGDLVTRLTEDISEYPRIAWFGCSGVFRFIDSFSKFAFCVGAMFLLDVRLALLAMIPVPLMLYVFYRARQELGSTYRRQQEAVSRTNNTIEAAFAGIRIVKAFNAAEGQQARLSGILRERIGIQLKLQRLVVLVHEMDHIASRLGQVIVLSVGGVAVIEGRLSIGTLYAFYVYLDMLIQPMMDLPNLFVTARQAFVSIDREEEILRHPVRPRTGTAPSAPLRELAMRGVSFRYAEGHTSVLEGVDFTVPQGRRVAIVGPVASGKTTMLRVLAGALPPREGRYTINGRDFSDYDWADLRGRIGYVPQESLLFSETIEENVAFGRSASEDWVRRCLEIAQMGPELARMDKGIATQLGQRGTLVSGGQKQRIAIARALAGRPELLLLDDCTSSLDARNEDLFWAGLEEAFSDVTTFVVSHRLATIRRAHTILVLDRGRLVDQGTHAELAGRCAVYQSFLHVQERKKALQGEADEEGSPEDGVGVPGA
jgi:ABC-type multidrug transport system fused ATPase/permease subunit